VLTNKMPFGAYRGFGKPQASFAMERGIDALADRLGLDPAEVRQRNLVRADQMPYPIGPKLRKREPCQVR
jgi:carbon-monoxide dehydrogenase large subunit